MKDQDPYLSKLLQLRQIVGYLGERAQYAWWPTAFYESSSRLFLEPVFTKTSQLAQYHGVLEAARQLHDEHLSVGSYHLFRLPEEIEEDLHKLAQSGAGIEMANQDLQSKETALEALQQFAGPIASLSIGPTAVGGVDDIESEATLTAMAATYLAGFKQNSRTYPYLAGVA